MLWHGESAWMNGGGSLRLIVCLLNQCVFLQSLESRTEGAVCPGRTRPLWHSFRGSCSADGRGLGWECTEGHSQSVSVPSYEFSSAHSKHFLNTQPPPLSGSVSVSVGCLSFNQVFSASFWKGKYFPLENPLLKDKYFQGKSTKAFYLSPSTVTLMKLYRS